MGKTEMMKKRDTVMANLVKNGRVSFAFRVFIGQVESSALRLAVSQHQPNKDTNNRHDPTGLIQIYMVQLAPVYPTCPSCTSTFFWLGFTRLQPHPCELPSAHELDYFKAVH